MALHPKTTEVFVVSLLQLDKHNTALQYPAVSFYIRKPSFIHYSSWPLTYVAKAVTETSLNNITKNS
jgi:hypothetical protein